MDDRAPAWRVPPIARPRGVRASSVDKAVRNVESVRLIDKRMFRHLFPDGEVMTERVLFISKSLIAVRRSGTH